MAMPKFKTKEEIPPAFLDLYEEKEGEWVAKTVEDEDTTGLKSALKKEREDREKAEKDAKAARAAAKKLEEEAAARKANMTSAELDELKTKISNDLRLEFQDEIDSRDRKIEALGGVVNENRSLKLDAKVKAQMLKSGVRGDRADALFRVVAEEFDLTEDGQPMVKKHPGKTLKVFLEDDLKKQYPEFYKGSQADGGGAGGHHSGLGVGTTAEDVLKNPAAALSAARAAS